MYLCCHTWWPWTSPLQNLATLYLHSVLMHFVYSIFNWTIFLFSALVHISENKTSNSKLVVEVISWSIKYDGKDQYKSYEAIHQSGSLAIWIVFLQWSSFDLYTYNILLNVGNGSDFIIWVGIFSFGNITVKKEIFSRRRVL